MRFRFARTFAVASAVFLAGVSFASRTGPWTKERAWEWYGRLPWLRGCNFMGSDCVNRVDQWQALGFEKRFETADRELALAASIGYNTVRLLVEQQGFVVWMAEHDGFMERFERTVALCAKHGIRPMIVLANDCMRPKSIWRLQRVGPQTYDWGYHGGRKLSQHGSFPNEMGYSVLDDPALSEKFYAMCRELMTKYRADGRIILWNLFNEPGNSRRWHVSVPHLQRLFRMGWEIDPIQPLAADLWSTMGKDPEKPAEKVAGELSDVISYHCYGNYESQVRVIASLRRRYGRPLFNTEWLHRINHNDVQSAYPLFYLEKVACYNWGFVAGLYQTYEPWESLWRQLDEGKGDELDFTKWQHDLFRPSLRPYDPKEIATIKRFNKLADDDFASAGPATGAAK